ncbi:enoyl-CoA hydratase/isomerase family protein [Desulfofundulus thermosubterraneus]|uniref:short-chain-enoyl-CoA hydratase n=1 Tax=Desulfofundulus thermosubterraneus DSM 16057 TaxID=1121432 RepID=A0A1M6E848_9FIRM|nr:enoyl-CoA hydratase-related protein [Desulfofundulus thermosubterraneus]SHI81593.1 enoyl-CoA hydratase [Desulfofundulus thermosubterraneus DSM 16057]
MGYSVIDYQIVQDHIAVVTLSRPESLNALNRQMFIELGLVFSEIERDNRIKAVILTGSGSKAFSAGADVSELQRLSAMEARNFALAAYRTQDQICSLPVPTIAALNGYALGGGCELAMCCDLRLASENARLGQPEINLGIIPGGGGTQRLARLVGVSRAKELIFTGKIIPARVAYEWGLVNRVVPLEELMETAIKLAGEIATKSRPVLALAKSAIDRGSDMDLTHALHYEIECFAGCFATEDHHEGIKAFLEKRVPRYTDR